MLNILNPDYPEAVSVGLVRNGSMHQVSVEKDGFQMEMFSVANDGYISLHFFGEGVCGELERVVQEQADRRLIIDLRDNEGGLWEEGIACLDLFLDRNSVLGYRQMADGTSIPILAQKEALHSAPMVIVINQGTKGPADVALVLQGM